jgi:nucleotide-binding universal stress UspA family protein
MSIFARILVPVDFSECSRRALKMALEMRSGFQARVRVVHVWQPPDFGGAELMVMAHAEGISVGEYGQKQAAVALRQMLDECGASADIESEVVVGDPRHSIVEYAKSHDVDLIIVGTHGRTGRARMFAGSVAEAVVRRAHVPVMTVQAPK